MSPSGASAIFRGIAHAQSLNAADPAGAIRDGPRIARRTCGRCRPREQGLLTQMKSVPTRWPTSCQRERGPSSAERVTMFRQNRSFRPVESANALTHPTAARDHYVRGQQHQMLHRYHGAIDAMIAGVASEPLGLRKE
jgi:hypothetical protein